MFITTKIARVPLFLNNQFKSTLFFSNLKNRFLELRTSNYDSINQFYQALRAFQGSLPHSEWVKLKKLIHDANKKVRRFNRQATQINLTAEDIVPQIPYTMDGSITCEYFYFKHTQTVFYKEELPYYRLDEDKPKIKTLPLQTVHQLVQQYLEKDIEGYLFQIVPLEEKYSQVMKLVRMRFEAIEEILCRHIFEGYTEFSNSQENILFKTQQKYKGKFKFQPIDPSSSSNSRQIISTFSKIAKNLACLNQCTSKVQLAVEMILTHHWKSLDSETLTNLLFCTSVNGKDLQSITTNIDECSASVLDSKSNSEFFSLLFYICVSGVQNKEILDQADLKLSQIAQSLNLFERLVLSGMVNYLSQVKQIDFVKIGKNILNKLPLIESDCQKDFTRFLDEKQYKYDLIDQNDRANILGPYKMVEVQQRKFICYSSLFYQPSNDVNSMNGVAKIINEYFNANNEKIKIINGRQLAKMDKRLEKEEYLKSKMKGLTKPEIKRERKFQFYSPREEYFEKKEQAK